MDATENSPTQNNSKRCQIELKHHTQSSNWDCGISCVLMVLSEKNREYLLDNKSEICKSEGFNTSTWTIDLCYLLKKFNVKHIFHTLTLGAHPAYEKIIFYNKIFTKDEHRINQRFSDAKNHNIKIRQDAISMNSILNHLAKGPIILLTNAKCLFCDICKHNRINCEARKMFRWPNSTYQGHYIVLCGYNLLAQRIFYRNPSLSDRVCVMPIRSLEEARTSYGTDQDAILIYP